MTRHFYAACAALALAGCGSSQQASETPTEPAEAPSTAPLPAVPAPTVTSTRELQIPAALRGRWGLVSADCTSTKGDNKGLLVVDAENLKFYESRAVLDVIKEVRESRAVASFSFSGEGQVWQMEETLELADDGRQLIRSERGENAMPGPLRYTRCA